MEATSHVLDPVVIGQDEQSELHVQPVIQSGRRQIDIRMWRKGPSGFAPSRNALTVEALDLDALYEGVSELLQASSGGNQVARVVWDKDEGRRLRAETEPFGTHFMARLGFWQRVRDTWRPADDGLVVAAEQLEPLIQVLDSLRTRFLEAEDLDVSGTPIELQAEQEKRWPTPGADWLTIDHDQVAFHPRGMRMTATLDELDGIHGLILRQWRRQESIWTPQDESISLTITALDGLLGRLRDGDPSTEAIDRPGLTPIRVRMQTIVDPPFLVIEEEVEEEYVTRLQVPKSQIPRFGRMLAQAGAMLIMHMTPAERDELLHAEGPGISPEIAEDALRQVEAEEETDHAEAEVVGTPAARAGGDEVEEVAEEVVEPERRVEHLETLRLGEIEVAMQGLLLKEDPQYLALHWEGRTLAIPIRHVQELLTGLRSLYYDALRGRHDPDLTIRGSPPVRVSIHGSGAGMCVLLDQEISGRMETLMFPLREVPGFLDTADSALARLGASLGRRRVYSRNED